MSDQPVTRAYHAFPLAGSPVGRLQHDATRQLASGLLPRCPHPEEPAFWYLPAGLLSCAACTDQLIRAAEEGSSACHTCGGTATALAAWVAGGVACLARLCEACHNDGVVPVAPN